jgi:hypothetical protein
MSAKPKSTKRVIKKVAKSTAKALEKRTKKKQKKRSKKSLFGTPSSDMIACCNSYLQSLLDPFAVRGARIPDEQVMPSVTFTTYDRIALTASTTGVFAIQLQLLPALQYDPASADAQFARGAATADVTLPYQWSGANATATSVWTGPVSTQPYSAAAPINQNYSLIRPVSAELRVYYTGATLEDSGLLMAGYVTGQQYADLSSYDNEQNSFNGQPIDGILTWPTVAAVPVNSTRVIAARYMPPDCQHQIYSDGYIPSFDYGGAQSPWTNWWTSYAQQPPYHYGTIIVAGQGLAAAAPLYAVAVINWEAIPWRNTYTAGDARVSTADPIANSTALNMSAGVPPVKTRLDASMPAIEPALSYSDGGHLMPPAQGAANVARAISAVEPTVATATSNTTTAPSITRSEPTMIDRVLSFAPKAVDLAGKLFGEEGGNIASGLADAAEMALPMLL